MGTIANKLSRLNTVKNNIKNAIINKGVSVSSSDTFSSYSSKIGSIVNLVGQSKSASITSNGSTSVTPSSGYNGLTNVSISTNVPQGARHFGVFCANYGSGPDLSASGSFILPANRTGFALAITTTQGNVEFSCSEGTNVELIESVVDGIRYSSHYWQLPARTYDRTITMNISAGQGRHLVGYYGY